MKGSFKLHEAQAKKKEEDGIAIDRKPCTVCGKVLAGPYGRWLQANDTEVWTCSKTHEVAYLERKKNDLQN